METKICRCNSSKHQSRRKAFPKETFEICEPLFADKEKEVTKAVSWAIREISKKCPLETVKFIKDNIGSIPMGLLKESGELLPDRERNEIMKKMIETERLILKPLTYEQLIKYERCDNSLELELNLNKTSRTISGELKEALEQSIIPNVSDNSKNYFYSTTWTAILKAENIMVGDICMHGEPNEDGEIEIGYGTYDEFQNKGFMTEIVKGIIDWIKTQIIVKSIIASTNKTNKASFRVLEKNEFIKIGETETLYNWKLELNKKDKHKTANNDGS